MNFARTREVVAKHVADDIFTCGAQIVIVVDGHPKFDFAIGRSGTPRPLDSDTIFRVYCAIKPLISVVVAGHVARGTIDLDQPLGDALSRPTRLPLEVTVRSVLTHTAGLHRTSALKMEMLTPQRRDHIIANAVPPDGWRVGRDAGYSEYVGWRLLGWLLEDVAQQPLREHLRNEILNPLSLSNTFIGMTDTEFDVVLPRIGLTHEFCESKMFPIVAERSRRWATETNPAHGGYTNARDLAQFYACLLDRLGSTGNKALPPQPVLRQFCTTARPSVYDAVLGRKCEYGLGVMTNLADHSFGNRCGPACFGHSGNIGASFGFADPSAHLAVGAVFNGVGSSDSAFLRRRLVVNAIYDDLDLHQIESLDHGTSPVG